MWSSWLSGRVVRTVIAAVTAVIVSAAYGSHLARMFEGIYDYSHLSEMEREIVFRTELGFYFSFYKTLVTAPTYLAGVDSILNDSVSEHGHTINALKRFNLYPELVLAFSYRQFRAMALERGWQVEDCWRTERGDGDEGEAILSCGGMGNWQYFYVYCAFAITGLVAGTLFLLGVVLSESLLGGALTALFFAYNHGFAMRAFFGPSLRETFGYPIFVALCLVVTCAVKQRLHSGGVVVVVGALTAAFMMSWQFAQFALSCHVGSLVVTFLLGYVPAKTLRAISFGHLLGFAVACVALFGNEMLLTSLFLSSCVAVQILLSLWPLLSRISFRPLRVALGALVFGGGAVGLKAFCGSAMGVTDDSHIFAILATKFSNYSDYHTGLYTCADDFEFIPLRTVKAISVTLLLPAGITACLLCLAVIGKMEYGRLLWTSVEDGVKDHGEVVFNLALLAAVAAMALMLKRLTLFFVPQLCVVASLLASARLSSRLFGGAVRPFWRWAALAALVAAASVRGVANVKSELRLKSDLWNGPQEQLFDWIAAETPPGAVFVATMPMTANIKLSTGRAIVNHPHYEDAGMRERTVKAYTIYSNKPPVEVHAVLKSLGADYAIFEHDWCVNWISANGKYADESARRRHAPLVVSRKCGLRALYDELDQANVGKHTGLCALLPMDKNFDEILPFIIDFDNNDYVVLRIV